MRALITGVTGQDGHYLSVLLRRLGYVVYGGYRRSTGAELPDVEPVSLELTEYESIRRAVDRVKPDEVYNLGAQSHVGESFVCPLYTGDVNYHGVLRILELVRETKVRVYQASTSEMFGGGVGLTEAGPFAPRSPYAVSKLAAHHLCGLYRRAYGVSVSCGILFNHESPLRGRDFVTRKVVRHAVLGKRFTLGNLEARRDWGHAADYVRAMHLMLQNPPDDYVVATGVSHSVAELVEEVRKNGFVPEFDVVDSDRPWDVDVLEGDASKIRALGWVPVYDFEMLIREMVAHEVDRRLLVA